MKTTSSTKAPREHLTAAEAAEILGITSRQVRRTLTPSMVLPGPNLPRLYSRSDVEREARRRHAGGDSR